jgi:hypothetical protein
MWFYLSVVVALILAVMCYLQYREAELNRNY